MFIFIIIVVLAVLYIRLNNRVAALEGYLRGRPAIPQPVVAPRKEESMLDVLKEDKPQITIPVQAAQPPVQPQQTPHSNLEYKFGSQIFTAVGAFAVIVGIAFFLTYAFQTGLINELARIVLGIISGIVLAVVGCILSRKYSSYGQTLIGTGLAFLYLSIYSSYNFYHFIPLEAAFMLMFGVTAVGVVLALSVNSQVLAGFAGLGGFLTPFLISGAAGDPLSLFSYVAVLDIGIVAIAFYRLWRPLVFGSFVGSYLILVSWLAQSYRTDDWILALFYCGIFFALFLAVSIIHYARQTAPEDEYDLSLIVGNAAAFFLLSFAIINPLHHDIMGLFTVALALVYIVLWLIIRSGEQRDVRFRSFVAGAGFVLLTIAIPIQFDKFVITIAWALEALVLAYIGTTIRSRSLKTSSVLLFSIVFVRLIAFDRFIDVSTPFINTRFITFIISLIAFALAFWVIQRGENSSEQGGEGIVGGAPLSIILVEAYVVAQLIPTLEIYDFFNTAFFVMVWSVFALLALMIAGHVKNYALRVAVYCTYVVVVLRLLFFGVVLTPATYLPILNYRFFTIVVAVVVFFISAYYLYTKQSELNHDEKTVLPILAVGANVLLIWAFSLEVLDFFNMQMTAGASRSELIALENVKRVALSIVWILYALVLTAVGITQRSAQARTLAIVIIGITVFKVFLYDTARLDNFYRFVSYISLGVILLLTGFLYNKYKDRIMHFIGAEQREMVQ